MTCSVDDCDKPVHGQGLCSKHYARFTRHGDPNIVLRTITNGSPVPYLDEMDDYGHTFDPDDDRHGTANGYGNLRCRCARCREANRVKQQEYMHGDPVRLEKHRLREAERRRRQRER